MNLQIFNRSKKDNEEDRPARRRIQDDDDKSDKWSLPDWPDFQVYHPTKIHRKKRKRHHHRKIRAESAENEEKVLPEAQPELATSKPVILSTSSTAGVDGTVDENETLVPASDDDGDTDAEGSDDDDDDDEAKQRGRWTNSCEFLLSIISMSVGMGNFYRFPFVAFQNGGGAFLIPYIFILTFVGRPMYFLELAVGQFCSFGQVKCWEMSPFFRGIGYGSALASFLVVTYYSSVMALTIYYLVHSFFPTLPWTKCDPEWATKEVCQMMKDAERNGSSGKMVANLPQLYFERAVMNEKDSINEGIGLPQWKLTLCLLMSWVIIFTVIARGVQSSGKVAYFTTFYPYVIILTLLITSCTKEGSFEGMLYFVTPDWVKIVDPNVWFAAAGQCFFSLSTGFGPIINYASYNTFHQPIYRDVMIVSFMDTLASFVAGLTVFATLGTLSHDLQKPIADVVKGGPGLVFISFSDAIGNFEYVPQILAVLFFLMMVTLAVGSSVAWTMAAISVISDQFPKFPKIWITTGVCCSGFLFALMYVTPGGQYMVTLMDNFGGNINIYILAIMECVGIAWIYGLSNFVRDVEFMLGRKLSWYWKLCWGFVVPVLLTIVLIYALVTAKRLEYNGKAFPDSAIICGWLLTTLSVIFLPIGAVYAICTSSGTFYQRFRNSLRSTAEFGPRNSRDREQWELYKAGKIGLDLEPIPDPEAPEAAGKINSTVLGSETSPIADNANNDDIDTSTTSTDEPIYIVSRKPPQKIVSAMAKAPMYRIM